MSSKYHKAKPKYNNGIAALYYSHEYNPLTYLYTIMQQDNFKSRESP